MREIDVKEAGKDSIKPEVSSVKLGGKVYQFWRKDLPETTCYYASNLMNSSGSLIDDVARIDFIVGGDKGGPQFLACAKILVQDSEGKTLAEQKF